MAAYEVLLLNTAIPQIQAAQSGDTYVCPRDIAFSAALTLSAGTANGVPYLNGSKVVTTGSALTFDGANLGVGVASVIAGYKLEVAGNVYASSGFFSSKNGGNQVYVGAGGQLNFGSGGSDLIIGTTAAPIRFGSTSTNAEWMRIDSSGNLGLGVTPSAWSTGYYLAQQIGGGGSFIAAARDTSNELTLGTNAYFDGTNWKRTVANYATLYKASSGAHAWFNAASSTAGSNISFTQAMTLDASGNLLLGLTSGTAKFDMAAGSGSQTAIRVRSLSTNSNGFNIVTDSTTDNIYLNNFYNAAMLFGTNNTERARITSGGYFKASNDGTYNGATGTYHELRNTANSEILYGTNTNANPFGVTLNYTAAAPNGTGNSFLQCVDNAATRAVIRSNGGLANFQANDVNLSDQRVKKDIVAAPSYWDKIKGIEIVQFKYKDQTHDDNNVGVIAQQVEQVAPEFVDQDGWGETPEDGVPLKSIYTSDMYHAAIKALQEAMARIEQLEAKVAAMGA